ncbi:bifunctional DNA-formamidopyrimidine glycosylase/DNA-(apurinic or apyrimidinic site) lyase [Dichotomicrobium thermohalophilum]|uniref:Formamidopyrimidine-DNA glycosylase n=1 Tax=Dichotomicrobium thermohalophilum TaxID=933063 RepID=A0A397Q7D9_9HYPH|nr:bifunctional DNA-formamidopyrimidine glycosylase/DNA-(apurinic or apyrimidinic site) lyase [Dichotomicrobium thermohalophilum]RIA55427.1 formamidopyrimidine-DNA glycosylase [Dichotomicrobium thermohalophilum]
MPELPEVETVRRGLAPVMEGARFVAVELRRPDLRFPFPDGFVQHLVGQRVRRLERRAKYLLAHTDNIVLAMHLGMSGRFSIFSPSKTAPLSAAPVQPGEFVHAAGGLPAHDHVVFDFDSGARVIYNDARRFGYMTLILPEDLESHPLLRDLGPEPVGVDLTPTYLAECGRGRIQPLKSFLLDQRNVAGLGNIYVCEALHRARLSPFAPAGRLSTATGRPSAGAKRLAAAIPEVLHEAIAAGGSSLRDHRRADGTLGYFQHAFVVYDREGAPCPRPDCGGSVHREVQNGRSTFYCPRCQR